MIECAQNLSGYQNHAYAKSLSEFGEPVYLPESGGSLLIRNIPGTSEFDAIGPYPLFVCNDWSALSRDLETLPEEIVTVSLVADPFGSYSVEDLNQYFDIVDPFKCHYIVDLNQHLGDIGRKHHRRQARKALKEISVEKCMDPKNFVEDWSLLYATLKKRYGIDGIRAFSRRSFSLQLSMEDVIVLQAFYRDRVVGAQLYFIQDDVVHCHLGAVNERGYETGAFYAMDYFSYEYFSGWASKLDLGGPPGLSGSKRDGLSQYKQGWCSETQQVYFCGRVMNADRYNKLITSKGCRKTSYFPAYRMGEFG